MIDFRNICDPHPLYFNSMGDNTEAGYTVIFLIAGLQERQCFYQGNTNIKNIGLRFQRLTVCRLLAMLANDKTAEMAPVIAYLSTVG